MLSNRLFQIEISLSIALLFCKNATKIGYSVAPGLQGNCPNVDTFGVSSKELSEIYRLVKGIVLEMQIFLVAGLRKNTSVPFAKNGQ
jgi:hypothetical protein